jgi:RimJ/RimL family protein N-acetyltransferase
MFITKTNRLVIRELQLDDAAFIVRILNDPSFIENIEDKGVRTPAQAVRFLAEGPMRSYRALGHGLYLVALGATLQPIGLCGLLKRDHLEDIDLGYAFLPEFGGRGYAFEACAAVLAYGRRVLGLRRACAIALPGNARSVSLLARLGFHYARPLPMPASPANGPGLPAAVALYEVDLPS